MDWGAEKAGVLIKTWMQVTAGDTCRVPLQGGARREKAAQAEHSPFKSAGEAAGRFLGAPLGRSQRLGTDATWRKTPRRLRRTLSLGRGKAGCPSPICGLCPQATKHLPRAHDGRWPQGGVDTSPGVPGIGKRVAEAVVPRVQDPPPPGLGTHGRAPCAQIQSYSRLRLTTVKGHRAPPAKGQGEGVTPRETRRKLPEPSQFLHHRGAVTTRATGCLPRNS